MEFEGSYKAAKEEYAEAKLFRQFLLNGKFAKIDEARIDTESYIGGLADATGEIVRYCLRQVTLGNASVLPVCQDAVEMVNEYMLDLDLTGHLRSKFDQVKRNLRRLEEMSYDLAIRE